MNKILERFPFDELLCANKQNNYLIRLRLKNALRLIFIGKSIAVAAKESGLRDSSYFGRMCRKYLGDSLQNILNTSTYKTKYGAN